MKLIEIIINLVKNLISCYICWKKKCIKLNSVIWNFSVKTKLNPQWPQCVTYFFIGFWVIFVKLISRKKYWNNYSIALDKEISVFCQKCFTKNNYLSKTKHHELVSNVQFLTEVMKQLLKTHYGVESFCSIHSHDCR